MLPELASTTDAAEQGVNVKSLYILIFSSMLLLSLSSNGDPIRAENGKVLKRLSDDDVHNVKLKQATQEAELRKVNEKSAGALIAPVPGLYLVPNQDGQFSYMMRDNGGVMKEVSSAVFNRALSEAFKRIRESACSLELKPSSIQISLGFGAFSWETKDVCK